MYDLKYQSTKAKLTKDCSAYAYSLRFLTLELYSTVADSALKALSNILVTHKAILTHYD